MQGGLINHWTGQSRVSPLPIQRDGNVKPASPSVVKMTLEPDFVDA